MDELQNNSQGGSPDADPATPDANIVDPDIANGALASEEAPVDPDIANVAASEEAPVDPDIANVAAEPAISVEELMGSTETPSEDETASASQEDTQLKAILEAIVYVAEEPLTLQEIGDKYGISRERVRQLEERLKRKLRAYLEGQIKDLREGALDLD